MIKVQKGQSATVTVYVDERLRAHATAASAEVRGPGDQSFSDPISAVVDETDAETTADAEPGATVIPVDPAPEVASGRRYLLLDRGRAQTVVAVARTPALDGVVIEEPLLGFVSEGARFVGQSVTVTIPSVHLERSGDGLVRFSATVGGVVRVWTDTLQVVRNIIHVPITAADLLATHPRARDLREATDTTLSSAIAAGWEMILHELRRRGFEEDRIRSASALALPTKTAVMYSLIRGASPDNPELLQSWQQSLRSDLDGAVASSRFWYDAEDEDRPKRDRHSPSFNETLRITR
jgi:hypothetical protein